MPLPDDRLPPVSPPAVLVQILGDFLEGAEANAKSLLSAYARRQVVLEERLAQAKGMAKHVERKKLTEHEALRPELDAYALHCDARQRLITADEYLRDGTARRAQVHLRKVRELAAQAELPEPYLLLLEEMEAEVEAEMAPPPAPPPPPPPPPVPEPPPPPAPPAPVVVAPPAPPAPEPPPAPVVEPEPEPTPVVELPAEPEPVVIPVVQAPPVEEPVVEPQAPEPEPEPVPPPPPAPVTPVLRLVPRVDPPIPAPIPEAVAPEPEPAPALRLNPPVPPVAEVVTPPPMPPPLPRVVEPPPPSPVITPPPTEPEKRKGLFGWFSRDKKPAAPAPAPTPAPVPEPPPPPARPVPESARPAPVSPPPPDPAPRPVAPRPRVEPTVPAFDPFFADSPTVITPKAPSVPPTDRLTLQCGPRRLHVFAGTTLKVGRAKNADVELALACPGGKEALLAANQELSREHFLLDWHDAQLRVMDGWPAPFGNNRSSSLGICWQGRRVQTQAILPLPVAGTLKATERPEGPSVPHWQVEAIPQASQAQYWSGGPPPPEFGQMIHAALLLRRGDVFPDDVLWLHGAVNLQALGYTASKVWLVRRGEHFVVGDGRGWQTLSAESAPGTHGAVLAYGQIKATSPLEVITG